MPPPTPATAKKAWSRTVRKARRVRKSPRFSKLRKIKLGYKLSALHAKAAALVLNLIKSIISIAAFIKIIPFELIDWNSPGIVVRKFKSWRRFLCYLSIGVTELVGGVKVGIFLSYCFTSPINFNWAVHTAIVLLAIVSTVAILTALWYCDEVVQLVNDADFLIKTITDKEGGQRWYTNPFVMFLLFGVTAFTWLTVLVIAPIVYSLRPEAPFAFYSYLPAEFKILRVRAAFVIAETVPLLFSVIALSVLIIICMGYVFQVLILLQDMQTKLKATDISAIFLSKSKIYSNFIATYRSIRIFNLTFNKFLRSFFGPAIFTTFIIMSVLSIYLALTTSDHIPMYIWVIFPLIATFCLTIQIFVYLFLASISIKSTGFLEDIRATVQQDFGVETSKKQLILSELQAIKPLYHEVGPFSVVNIDYPQIAIGQIFDFLLLFLSF